ncbi:MAG: hypothetical protein P8R54_11960 [Myxococcota bacterium]|nr:hypothetical protein [Myxococcota bacterium]
MNHSLYILSLTSLGLVGCQSDKSDTSQTSGAVEYVSPDLNGDGSINILVLGTSASISGQEGFSAAQVAVELSNILDGDPAFTGDVSVRAEDIHTSQAVTIGLGQAGDEYTYSHYSHSLLQYYYWPEDAGTRMDNLSGGLEHDWDYVVIAADPFIVSTTPGYYALGAHKVASKVAEGGAQPLLMMVWDPDQADATIDHFEEVTYRTADGAAVALSAVPAGLAWAALTDEQRDEASGHPTPGGAYLSAASIYSHITQTSAGDSEYQYDSDMAEVALDTVSQARDQAHYEGDFLFDSPFARCGITDEQLTYNHTGSSSENGILEGLSWVFDQADETLESGEEPLITFNYGRANTNFEPEKRYQIDPDRFQYSFGFPMQDNGNHGDTSMLYGLDKRDGGVINDTDLGVASYMIDESELPYGRAIPIRTLFAQLREVNPEQSAYRDSWHMHRDLDKASAAYMYTMLTNKCALGEEPADATTSDWYTWSAHKIGCSTAWTVMYLDGNSPF